MKARGKAEFARGTPFKDLVAAAEREIVVAALEANEHHISNTARELQLERSHLYKKMRALGHRSPRRRRRRRVMTTSAEIEHDGRVSRSDNQRG